MAVQIIGSSGYIANVDINGSLYINLGGYSPSNTNVASWTSSTPVNTAVVFVNGFFGYQTLLLTLNQTSTITGGVVVVQGSNDNSNFVSLAGVEPGSAATIVQNYTLVASTYQTILYDIAGWQYIRLLLSTAITGTGTVTVGYAATQLQNQNANIVPVSFSGTLNSNLTQVGGTSVGAATAWGTAPTGNVQGTNAELFAGNTALTATGSSLNVNVTGTAAVTQSTSPWVVAGNLTNNNATPAATNVGVLPAIAEATVSGSLYTSGRQVLLVTDTAGNLNTDLQYIAGNAVSTAATGVQLVGIEGHTGAALDVVIGGATAAANALQIAGVYNSTLPTLANGQGAAIQLDAKGQQLVDVNYWATTALGATAVVNYGSTPAAVTVPAVNAFVTNTVAENLTQVAGITLGATAVTNFGTAPAAAAVPGVNASIFSGTTAITNTGGSLNVNITGSTGGSTSVVGTLTNNNAAPGANNLGVLPAIAETAYTTVTYTTGDQVLPVTDLHGALNTDLQAVGGTAVVTAAAGVQKVGIVGSAGATLDATVAAGTAPTNGLAVLTQYNTTQPAPTNTQTVALQSDQSGNLLTFPGPQTKTGAAWTSSTAGGTAQYTTGTATIGQPAGSPVVFVTLDQTSTITAGAVTFQGTYDGVNWITLPANQLLNPNTYAQIANPYTFVANTNQSFMLVLQGLQNVRISLSTAITGTGSVTPYWYVPSDVVFASATVSGTVVASGNLTNNNAAPTSNNTGSLVGLAATSYTTNTYTTGNQVLLVTDLHGAINDDLQAVAGIQLGATAVVNYGSTPAAVAVPAVNAFVTNSVTVTASGTLTNNNAAPAANNLGVLPALAGSAAPTYTSGDQVLLSVDTSGNTRTGDKSDFTVASGVGTTPGFAIQIGGQYNTTAPAPTTGQSVAMQMDQSGNKLTYPGLQTETGAAWTSATAAGTFQYNTGTTTAGQNIGGEAVVIQLDQTTTLTAGAVTFQGTLDGVNWVTIPVSQVLSPVTLQSLTNPYSFVASTNQPFLILTQGYRNIRLDLSTAITGTGSVTPYWATLGYNPIRAVTIAPSTTTGTSRATGSIGATVTAIKTTGGNVFGWYIYNSNTTVAYVQFFNLATGSVTLGTTAPFMSLGIPPIAGANVLFDTGILFSTAITIAITTTRAGATSPTNTVDYNIMYL
jgi:hypothetical protein